MVSLRDLGLLLLAAPMAIAAPFDVSTETAPRSKSEDTSQATSAPVITLPVSKALSSSLEARCDQTPRSTTVRVYSDSGCKDELIHALVFNWNPCSVSQTQSLANGATFGSMVWISGSHAQLFAACQFGHSCSDEDNEIVQNPGVCSGGGGRRFDKIQIIP
ncbi:hypothetical protein ACLX1H_000180 [Fusarium chlamydosporum]